MSPGGRIYKEKTVTGKTVTATEHGDVSNTCTPTNNKGNIFSYTNQYITILYKLRCPFMIIETLHA